MERLDIFDVPGLVKQVTRRGMVDLQPPALLAFCLQIPLQSPAPADRLEQDQSWRGAGVVERA